MAKPLRRAILVLAATTAFAAESAWERNIDLAVAASARHDYSSAEHSLLLALAELDRLDPFHPKLAATLNSLGLIYRAENKLPPAEIAFRRSLAITRKTTGLDSLETAAVSLNLGSTLLASHNYNVAETFLQNALRIYTRQLGEHNPKTAGAMAQMGEMYRSLDDYPQAEPMLKKAAAIQQSTAGADAPELAVTLNSLAELYATQNLDAQAQPLFKRVMYIREATTGMQSPEFLASVERYAFILEKLGNAQGAARYRKLADTIRNLQKPAAPKSPSL